MGALLALKLIRILPGTRCIVHVQKTISVKVNNGLQQTIGHTGIYSIIYHVCTSFALVFEVNCF